jgi:D-amino peptidase
MKIFLSFDMEGVAGVVDWSQCRPTGGDAYRTGCRLLLGEVNAAIDGAVAGGADQVVLNDSHGAMFNLDPAEIHRPATYLAGRHKPGYMMQGLDDSFDAAFFVGYHGSISGEPSAMSHTYNPEVITAVTLNGTEVGESGINALAAHAASVPIALISGDDVTIAAAQIFAADALGVVTKHSVTRFAAHNLHPAASCELIAAGAERAVRAVADGRIAVPRIEFPATLEVHFGTADMAEVASGAKGVERSGTRSVQIVGTRSADGAAMYASFVAVTYITRQAGGR